MDEKAQYERARNAVLVLLEKQQNDIQLAGHHSVKLSDCAFQQNRSVRKKLITQMQHLAQNLRGGTAKPLFHQHPNLEQAPPDPHRAYYITAIAILNLAVVGLLGALAPIWLTCSAAFAMSYSSAIMFALPPLLLADCIHITGWQRGIDPKSFWGG